MNSNWVKVYESPFLHQVELCKAILADENIDAVIVNKQDSMYVTINSNTDIELYVDKEQVVVAKHLLSKNQF
jgi:hypothetical protein